MMSPEQKAEELIRRFALSTCGLRKVITEEDWNVAKECAIISVDEILNMSLYLKDRVYWIEVKREISNL